MPSLKRVKFVNIHTTVFVLGLGIVGAGLSSLTTSAFAQEVIQEGQTTIELDHFALADANADTMLDMDEFKSYIISQADAGDADAIIVRDQDDYENVFTAHDTDEDALLSRSEIEAKMSEDLDPVNEDIDQ